MLLICPKCKEHLDFTDDPTGSEVTCPFCGYAFIATAKRSPRIATPPPPPARPKNANFGAFLLGFFFPVIGIALASMTGGSDGAKAATRGFIASLITVALFYFACEIFQRFFM